ncbi:MAG: methyltransferase domain-containing protein [Gammaproteobacteria bacterium]
MADIPLERTSQFAWANYKAEVERLIVSKSRPDIIEIGAGRNPLFSELDLPENVGSYTLGDISRKELDLAPRLWNKSCFDICGDVSSVTARFDVAFTRMLAEHVPDGYRFHSNVFSLLKPGGVAIHFMPTLFSPPFVINKVLPDRLSRKILSAFFSNRNDEEIPKFPAHYSMCYGKSARLIKRYRSIGYTGVDVRTFYGHGYFSKIPILRELDDTMTNLAHKWSWTLFGAYAFVTLAKPELRHLTQNPALLLDGNVSAQARSR